MTQPMTIIEKMARAMYEDDAALFPGDEEPCAWGILKDLAPGKYAAYCRSARAALIALREPTEAMVEAGFRAREHGMTMGESAKATWTAMIDAALNEKG